MAELVDFCEGCGEFGDDCTCAEGYCTTCDNDGFVVVCPDDLCHNAGEPGFRCIHGDGDVPCWNCDGLYF